MYLLDFLNNDPTGRPPFPNCHPSIQAQNNPVHGWIFAQGLSEEAAILNNHLESVKVTRLQQDNAQTRQMSMTMSAQPSRPDKIKVPMPSKYNGKKGDPALTFLAACNNYCIMSPGAFADDTVCVRWALQQLEDKAGQWAIRQMQRMDLEIDAQGRPPKELRKWKNFGEFFLIQFGDPGLQEKA